MIRWRGVFLHKYIYNLLSVIIDHTLIHLWLLFLWIKTSFIADIFVSIYNVCRKSNTTCNCQLSKWYCITICTSWNIYFRVNIILRLWIKRIKSWALNQNMTPTRIHINGGIYYSRFLDQISSMWLYGFFSTLGVFHHGMLFLKSRGGGLIITEHILVML